jgi:vacuolar-type H+-ATPase subunit F/Vma7
VRIIVLGDADDVRGFALAGVEGHVCQDLGAAESTLAQIGAQVGEVGLVLISAAVAGLASRAVERLRRQEGSPAVVILPQVESPLSPADRPNRRLT